MTLPELPSHTGPISRLLPRARVHHNLLIVALWLFLLPHVHSAESPAVGEASIHVRASQTIARITPYMTGSCIEDVNHEIYGGIYSQMLYGESFDEPGLDLSLEKAGFAAFGGDWRAGDEGVRVGAGPGFKLVAKDWVFSDEGGEAEVELRFPSKTTENAGLILQTRGAGVGADDFDGYEIALGPRAGYARVARHRHDYQGIRDVPFAVPLDTWIRLRATLKGKRITLLVDGKEVISVEDEAGWLPAGAVGLRTWNSDVVFRNLTARSGAKSWGAPLTRASLGGPAEEISGLWRPVREGSASGEARVETEGAFNGKQCQMLSFSSGEGTWGIDNMGLNRWGLHLQGGKPYVGYFHARSRGPVEVIVALRGDDGTVLAEQPLSVNAEAWTQHAISLTPRATASKGSFAILLRKPGAVCLDQVFLSPGSWGTFRNLPVRRDIAEALLAQGLTVLRLGGWMINAEEYRWKSMRGPREKRPPYRGNWYPWTSNGWGIIDFLDFCEKAGFLPVVAVNIEETPEDMEDFLEYSSGPIDSKWGGLRAADGHPSPYGLRHIQIGNEETLNDHYVERFALLSDRLCAKDPGLTVIIAAWFDEKNPAARKLIELSRGKRVLWDVHVGGDDLRAGDDDGNRIRRIGELFRAWCPEAGVKVCILEENGGLHNLQRALGHAHMVNTMERMGDLVLIDCPANCLQPLGQNDNGWDQGQVFFTPSRVWGMPPYYAQQMIAASYQPRCVASALGGQADTLDVTATRSEDGSTVVVKVVNIGAAPVRAKVSFDGFVPSSPTARIVELTGELSAVNTPAEPERIAPRERVIERGAEGFTLELPAHSFTVATFR